MPVHESTSIDGYIVHIGNTERVTIKPVAHLCEFSYHSVISLKRHLSLIEVNDLIASLEACSLAMKRNGARHD